MNYNEIDLRGLTADQQLTMSQAFPVLMRKVYVWMTLALAITGFTAYAVANSPGILQAHPPGHLHQPDPLLGSHHR